MDMLRTGITFQVSESWCRTLPTYTICEVCYKTAPYRQLILLLDLPVENAWRLREHLRQAIPDKGIVVALLAIVSAIEEGLADAGFAWLKLRSPGPLTYHVIIFAVTLCLQSHNIG